MSKQEDHFTPEAIEQQTSDQPGKLSQAESLLLQHISLLTQAHAQENQRSLEQIWQRLQQSQEQTFFPQDQQFPQKRKAPQELEVQAQPVALTFPVVPPARRPGRLFTLAAAVLVTLLLTSSLLVVIINIHPAGSNSTITPPALSPQTTDISVTTLVPFPAQDCPDTAGDPAYTNTSWYRLCQAGQFVSINQKLPVAPGSSTSLIIEAAYADRNMLFLINDITPVKLTDEALINEVLITGQETRQEAWGQTVRNNGHFTLILGYDTNDLPASLSALKLQVQASVSLDIPSSSQVLSTPLLTFSPVTIPLHQVQTLTPHQAVTANGLTFTLDTMIIGASGTRLVWSTPDTPLNVFHDGLKGILQTPQEKASNNVYELLPKTNNFEFMFWPNLVSEPGAWTLTVTSSGVPQPWVFHFTVPA